MISFLIKECKHLDHSREPEKFALEEPLIPLKNTTTKYSSICCVNLRKGVSRLNFMGYLMNYIALLLLLLGSSLLFTLLIEDPRYFNIPPTQTSAFVGSVTFTSSIVSLFVS